MSIKRFSNRPIRARISPRNTQTHIFLPPECWFALVEDYLSFSDLLPLQKLSLWPDSMDALRRFPMKHPHVTDETKLTPNPNGTSFMTTRTITFLTPRNISYAIYRVFIFKHLNVILPESVPVVSTRITQWVSYNMRSTYSAR